MCLDRTTPVSALEFVVLPLSCSQVANKVVFVPSTQDQFYAIVGDREQRTVKFCMPGPAGKCQNWTTHRFDVLCGGRKVHWNSIAEWLLRRPAEQAGTGHAQPQAAASARALRILSAEPGFAPVNEVGAFIFSFADIPTEQSLPPRPAPDTATVKEIADEAPLLPQAKPDVQPQQPKQREVTALTSTEEAPSFEFDGSQTRPAGTTGAISGQPGSPSIAKTGASDEAEAVPVASLRPTIEIPDMGQPSQLIPPKRTANSESDTGVASMQPVSRDDPPPARFAPQSARSEQVGRHLIVQVSTFLLTFIFIMTVIGAVMLLKSMRFSPRRGAVGTFFSSPSEPDADADADAEACREMMRKVAVDLTRASTAVSNLKGVPALQSALYKELDSIRRLLGFAPQAQDRPAEREDWQQIRSRLVTSLQGTQRIIGIAEAARASFSFQSAAIEVITTRLDACAFLGVSTSSSEVALKKAVNALRQCWHPDLAADDEDRRLREIRTKQINVAWDLISGKQKEAY